MKKILFIFSFFFSFFLNVHAQNEKLNQLFDQYQDTEGVTSIKISKAMFGMLSNLDLKDAELDQIKPLLKKINGLKILILEKPDANEKTSPENQKQTAIFQNLTSKISNSLKSMNFDELMTVNSKDSKIKFLSSDTKNGILDNLLLNISTEGNTVLMMLDGKITMDDVNKLAEESQKFNSEKNNVITENISSSGDTQVRNVEKFDGIKVSNGIKVSFTQDSKQSVVVNTDRNLQKYVKTESDGEILKIYIDNQGDKNLSFKKLFVEVSAPELTKIAVNSGANFTTQNMVKSDFFQIATTSGAHLNADLEAKDKVEFSATSGSSARLSINAKTLEASATSGSDIVLDGKIDETAFSVSSAATVNAQDLVSKNSTISASSASTVKVNVSEKINANISSSANVHYRSNTTVDKNATISSGGSMKSF